MNTNSLAYHLTTTLLRVALVVVIIGAGWSIYRQLPDDTAMSNDVTGATALQIILRPSPREEGAALNISVQLYPVDRAAVEREFESERRPGMRPEDFLKERMRGRAPIETQLDANGQATVMVAPGKWWLYAVLSEARNAEWRLPLNVSGRQQTVELNAANMYTRTQSF